MFSGTSACKRKRSICFSSSIGLSFTDALTNVPGLTFLSTITPANGATVSRISENINTQYRNERIEMDVWNKDGALSPGMFANVVFVNKGNNTAMNVLKSAVVASTERKYVLLMQHGKVSKVDVITGNATASNIEVFGALQVGDRVIAQASDEIKEGVVAN